MRKPVHLSDEDILTRLVILETLNKEQKTNLELTREIIEKEKIDAKNSLDCKIKLMNDLYQSTFATKDDLQKIARLVYIGLGILLTLELLFKFFFKG